LLTQKGVTKIHLIQYVKLEILNGRENKRLFRFAIKIISLQYTNRLMYCYD